MGLPLSSASSRANSSARPSIRRPSSHSSSARRAGAYGRPRAERRAGRLHRGVHVRRAGIGDRGEELAGGRVLHLEPLTRGSRPLGPGDHQPAGALQELLKWFQGGHARAPGRKRQQGQTPMRSEICTEAHQLGARQEAAPGGRLMTLEAGRGHPGVAAGKLHISLRANPVRQAEILYLYLPGYSPPRCGPPGAAARRAGAPGWPGQPAGETARRPGPRLGGAVHGRDSPPGRPARTLASGVGPSLDLANHKI